MEPATVVRLPLPTDSTTGPAVWVFASGKMLITPLGQLFSVKLMKPRKLPGAALFETKASVWASFGGFRFRTAEYAACEFAIVTDDVSCVTLPLKRDGSALNVPVGEIGPSCTVDAACVMQGFAVPALPAVAPTPKLTSV